ncbi:MAG: methylmalonyl-CoA mutase, N-terminal domain [Solirubrobacteraceae bacterium]|jgi:methylmalonyl-CoA mutase N-terminal domain/subunit|nr:methylmalonyl-CoA mutase, N-terminal domain [Solirubrobacteraceae bacterium]
MSDATSTRPAGELDETPEFVTNSGLPVAEAYGPEDLADWSFDDKVGRAGGFPYTRGPYPSMYRGRSWTRRQVVGLGTATETNLRNKYVIAEGQTGISNDFDVPTLIGLDSDDPRSKGEVGRTGVAIDTLQDMRDLFDGIPLDEISVSQTINHPAAVLLAMYVVAAEERGYALSSLAGTTQNDPLKDFYAQKTFIFPPRPSLRLAGDMLEYCSAHMPRWNGISINGYNVREAGTTAPQELGFTFSHAVAYIEELLGRGMDVDDFAPRFSFLFNVHNDFFEEVAKLRAARRMWAHLLRDRFGAKNPHSCRLRMHVQTGGSTLTYQQPEVNLIRGAIQALAGAVGGTQSMAVSCYDEAFSIPSEKAQRLSLRTQQVVAHEAGVSNTVDPLAGSYYVESLTDELERQAYDVMASVDERGGVIVCLEEGWLEQAISDSAHLQQLEVMAKKRIIVGVNEYELDEEYELETFRVGDESEHEQLRRLAEVKASRDDADVQRTLEALREAARDGTNVMPAVIDATRRMATQGEMVSALIDVFGEYQPPAIY